MFRMHRLRALAAFVCIAAASALASAAGQDIDPRGLYLNSFSGAFDGTEWFQIVPLPQPRRYRMTDIRGGGFEAEIDLQGNIRFSNGSGKFPDQNNYRLTFPLDGRFTFVGNRVPLTDAEFPVELTQPPPSGDARYAGNFQSRTERIDLHSGAVLGGEDEALTITVEGTTLRITDPAGLYFQGVFTGNGRIAFRDVAEPRSAEFASFPGSSQNLGQDMLGDMRYSDADHFTATILLQSQAALGSEEQTLLRFTAERKIQAATTNR